MGCDIHRYLEYKDKNADHWYSTPISGQGFQNYALFGFLEEGVREIHNPEKYYIHEPVGLPEDIGFHAKHDFYLTVNDEYASKEYEKCITKEKAEKYITDWPYLKVIKNKDDEIEKIQDPNWYGMTYIDLEEFDKIIESYKKYLIKEEDIPEKFIDFYIIEIMATYNYMKTYNDCGYQTRIVYWFDS